MNVVIIIAENVVKRRLKVALWLVHASPPLALSYCAALDDVHQEIVNIDEAVPAAKRTQSKSLLRRWSLADDPIPNALSAEELRKKRYQNATAFLVLLQASS